jgi:hypothetical protein
MKSIELFWAAVAYLCVLGLIMSPMLYIASNCVVN